MDNELERLGERIAEQAAHLDAATHRLLADLRVFDERGGWRAQGALSCAHWLSWRVGWGLGTARDHVRVARKIVEFPEIDDALRRGEVSYCKVRAMLRIATPANEHLLLEYARLMTGSQLEETCRKYALVLRHGTDPHPLGDLQRRYVRRRDTEDGMVKIEAVLHAEEAELVWTMLNHAATQLTRTPEAATGVSAETAEPSAVRNVTSSSPPLQSFAADVSAETAEPSQPSRPRSIVPASPAMLISTCGSDVSAETGEPSAVRNATSSLLPLQSFAADVSAETAEPPHPRSTIPASPSNLISTCGGDVSAETAEPSTVRNATSSLPPLQSFAADVSAETAEPSQPSRPRSTVPASPAMLVSTCDGDVSAETGEPSQPRSTVPASPAMLISTCGGDVSAETGEPSQPRSTVPASPAMLISTCDGDVSAETGEPSQPRSTVPASPAMLISTCGGDVSAETGEPSAVRNATSSLPPLQSFAADVSAETAEPPHPRSTIPASPSNLISTCGGDASAETWEPGILDRLLDEAEMLRAAEAPQSSECDAVADEPSPGSGTGVLQQRADATRRAFDRADALVSLAQGYLRGDRPHRAPIEVVLTIPASSLRKGGVDPVEVGELGESFVSGEVARRISCDGGVVEVIEDERGTPLSVGRKRRTITGPLKRALVKRDRTCTYPGCTNRLFLEGHHIQHWADGGETSLMNAALLCSTHHRYVHEYGYTIELGSDRRPQFRDPHGRLVAIAPERPLTVGLGWPRICAANEPLGISADTIACEWDGTPVNYGAIIGHLAVADHLQ